jgi:hypothetical protein
MGTAICIGCMKANPEGTENYIFKSNFTVNARYLINSVVFVLCICEQFCNVVILLL